MARKLRIIFISLSVLFIGSIFSGAYFTDSESISSNEFQAGQWTSPAVSPTTSPTASPTVTPTSGEIIITEFIANPEEALDSKGEWFEIYNATSSTIDLYGWRYRQNDGADLTEITTHLMISSGEYMVFGKNADTSENGGVVLDYTMASNFNLNNNIDTIIIEKPDGVGGYITVDSINYDSSGFDIDSGISNILLDVTSDNSNPTNWGQSTIPFGDGDLGTPGGNNV